MTTVPQSVPLQSVKGAVSVGRRLSYTILRKLAKATVRASCGVSGMSDGLRRGGRGNPIKRDHALAG